MLRIWELHVDADPHLCVQAPDLRYFKDKFDGRPMKNGWAAPPYEILGRSKEVADFTSWQIGSTFLVSSKAREVLGWAPQVTVREGLERTFQFFAHRRQGVAQ